MNSWYKPSTLPPSPTEMYAAPHSSTVALKTGLERSYACLFLLFWFRVLFVFFGGVGGRGVFARECCTLDTQAHTHKQTTTTHTWPVKTTSTA